MIAYMIVYKMRCDVFLWLQIHNFLAAWTCWPSLAFNRVRTHTFHTYVHAGETHFVSTLAIFFARDV